MSFHMQPSILSYTKASTVSYGGRYRAQWHLGVVSMSHTTHLSACNTTPDTNANAAGAVHSGDGHRDSSSDGQRGQSGEGQTRHNGDGQRGQEAGPVRDRLLVAATAALASLAGNADTHFAMVNEGAAPALVAALQHGTFPCNFMHAHCCCCYYHFFFVLLF